MIGNNCLQGEKSRLNGKLRLIKVNLCFPRRIRSQDKSHLRIGHAQVIQNGCDQWCNGTCYQAESNV